LWPARRHGGMFRLVDLKREEGMAFWVRRFGCGIAFVSLAVAVTAANASAAAQITVDPNAQYGAYTHWLDGVGEDGSQGLVMDNSAPPGVGVPGSFAAAKVSGTNGLPTTGIQL